MLVLGRMPGEIIEVWQDGKPVMQIVMVQLRGNGSARIGIEASREFEIHRKEVADAIRNERAAQAVVYSPHTAPLQDDGGPQGEPQLGHSVGAPIPPNYFVTVSKEGP